MKKSKFVTSWFVTKEPNGIYSLIINTTEKYCYCQYIVEHDNKMLFVVHNYSDGLIPDDTELEIPNFLPKIDGVWIKSSLVEKDQIQYYFIPYLKEYIKNPNRIILKSEDYEQNSK